MELQTQKPMPRAHPGKSGKGASAAGKGGFVSAIKSAFAHVGQLLASGGSGKASSLDEEDGDAFVSYGPRFCCSCKPVLKLEPS